MQKNSSGEKKKFNKKWIIAIAAAVVLVIVALVFMGKHLEKVHTSICGCAERVSKEVAETIDFVEFSRGNIVYDLEKMYEPAKGIESEINWSWYVRMFGFEVTIVSMDEKGTMMKYSDGNIVEISKEQFPMIAGEIGAAENAKLENPFVLCIIDASTLASKLLGEDLKIEHLHEYVNMGGSNG